MKHIIILQRAHAYLRGIHERTVDGVHPIDKDKITKEINDYLNEINTHSHGCWSWGPQHYMCAYEEIKRMQRELDDKA